MTNPIEIENKIYTIRGMHVMLDSDIATLYQVETKRVNEAVRRNKDKFPDDLMFELTKEEAETLRSQSATFKESLTGRKYFLAHELQIPQKHTYGNFLIRNEDFKWR